MGKSNGKKAAQPNEVFRALTYFEKLPSKHVTFAIDDDASEPHLKRGEYAVIDKGDRSPAKGELYLIRFSKEGRCYVKQLRTSEVHFVGDDGPTLGWWVDDLRGFRSTGKKVSGIPVFAGLSDGPYSDDRISSIIVGRIVGYAEQSLERR